MHTTVSFALRSAISLLTTSSSPRSDAEELLSRLLGVERSALPALGERLLTPDEAERFASWLVRREAREPVQYITGRAAFRDLDLAVDRRVLIPRPETEGLVELVLEVLRAERQRWPAPRVLDLGTGSGAVALAIAAEWPPALVTASDASEEALAVARANAAATGLAARVTFRHGDWFEAVGPAELFEIVVSNPPYVATGEHGGLPADVRDFEPRQALLAGGSGLDATLAILRASPWHLVADGWLALELAEDRAAGLADWAAGREEWAGVELLRDLAGRPRYLLARRGPNPASLDLPR